MRGYGGAVCHRIPWGPAPAPAPRGSGNSIRAARDALAEVGILACHSLTHYLSSRDRDLQCLLRPQRVVIITSQHDRDVVLPRRELMEIQLGSGGGNHRAGVQL